MEGMWSLIFFTLLVQAASGMVMLQAFFGDAKAKASPCWPKLALGFALIGTVFSLLHLSAPMHSVFTINNIFFSWLSREIFCVGLFVALLFLFVFTQKSICLYACALAGIMVNYAMSKIYTEALVPYWQNISVFGYFLSTSFVLGALLLGAFALACPHSKNNKHEKLTQVMRSWVPVALSVALAVRIGFSTEHLVYKTPLMSSFAVHASPILLALSMALVLLLQRHNLCSYHNTFKALRCSGLYTLYGLLVLIFIVAGELLGRLAFYQGYTWFGM